MCTVRTEYYLDAFAMAIANSILSRSVDIGFAYWTGDFFQIGTHGRTIRGQTGR